MFPNYFIVKDLSTGASLAQGQSRNNLYKWPSSTAPSMSIASTSTLWHQRLGHPSFHIQKKILDNYNITVSDSKKICDSSMCNKSHKLLFKDSSIVCDKPFQILYFDVWGPTTILSFVNLKYYVIFVAYYTKYTWLYPLKLKSEVGTVFDKFKKIVEIFFELRSKPYIQMVEGNIKLYHFTTIYSRTYWLY